MLRASLSENHITSLPRFFQGEECKEFKRTLKICDYMLKSSQQPVTGEISAVAAGRREMNDR
jgi:hypothetical protein